MKKRILIYDDDNEILILCQALLQKFGYEVYTISRCENVVSDVESIRPDLVLLDLWIPTIGGEKAVVLLKNNEATKDVPVLLFSANADIQEIAQRVHAQGYVEKPFSIEHLLKLVKLHTELPIENNQTTTT